MYLVSSTSAWTEGDRVSNFKITITEAREISMEVLRRYTAGQQSWDENVSTALTALNSVLRMGPSLKHPFRVGSFFNDKNKKALGNMPLGSVGRIFPIRATHCERSDRQHRYIHRRYVQTGLPG
ncbi:hypothetical protein IW261DRAFT_900903 [Armillaria novae-zelandiae]|uniref:Protein argonaute N-terminal domain-containing protein n=1 Tax=Armillaria novae-zelandiae TaxID=153914 RepID=A0AA39NSX3_9AGAR|nr:hypothetical protein IW261DRAFT_900903 [Armillaria novae-zelandiae]